MSQLRQFLHTRERGALFANAGLAVDNELPLDWLPFSTVQHSMDRILQGSVGVHRYGGCAD
jgi:hypothetical protein